jgi:subtilase family serine protease
MGTLCGGHRAISRLVLVGCLSVLAVHAAEDRISTSADGNQTVLIGGPIHPRAIPENDRGPVASTLPITGITLNVKMSANQQAELDGLLEEQRDPSSASFQKWLTPEEFGSRFGLSHGDLGKLTSWLRSQGFTVDHVARGMNWISFSGTAAQVDAAFHAALHTFLVDGETHFANTNEPSVPAAFAHVIAGFQGLNDFRLKPQRLKTRVLSPDFTSSNGMHNLAPGDVATIYDAAPLYNAGIDGTGQKIVVAGQTDINLSDIQAFRTQFGLSANPPQLVLYGADPGTVSGDMEEADLDLEWSGATARNAAIIYVYSRNVISSVQYAISQNLAPVISLSYGGCEAENSSTLRSVAQQANAQGITWLASSGDSGAAGCDSKKPATHGLGVNSPASIPEVTGVGGSEFNEGTGAFWSATNGANGGSALSYIPEMAWNDTATRTDLAATGGGASIFYSKPAWQTGLGVPADGARDVPDVSLSASPDHDGYYFYSGGSLQIVGGTSVSTPIFAGIVGLLNHYLVSKGVQPTAGLGNINPTLYHLASNANSIFHDIAVGNNIVPCTTGSPDCVGGSLGFSAGPGYDEVTGLGSVDANNLVTQWTSLPSSISTTTTLTANPTSIASTASTTLTATVKPATGTTAPSGSVTFSLGAKTLGVVSTVVSGSNATASLTVSGTSLANGNNTIIATYGGSATFNGSTAAAIVAVTGPPVIVSTTSTLTANPSSISTTGMTTLTATVRPASGTAAPTGNVTFTLGTTTLGAVTLSASGSNATASYSVSATKLATGNNLITMTYGGATGFTGSSATATVTVTTPVTPGVATTTAVSANPASISPTASTVLTVTVKPATGTAAPTGSVSFTLGTVTLGSATLTATGSTATATLTVSGAKLSTGANTISAMYAGTTAFGASSGTVGVTVTGNTADSVVAITVTPNPVVRQRGGWFFAIQLADTGGPTTLTSFTVNGTSYAQQIPAFFGSSSLPAGGKLTSSLQMTNVPVPTSIIFGFGGTDANGHPWTQTVTVPFQ